MTPPYLLKGFGAEWKHQMAKGRAQLRCIGSEQLYDLLLAWVDLIGFSLVPLAHVSFASAHPGPDFKQGLRYLCHPEATVMPGVVGVTE